MKTLKAILIVVLLLMTGGGIAAFAADDSARNIGQEVVQQAVINVKGGSVEIENSSDEEIQVVIYGITGQIVKSFAAQPGDVTAVDLTAGYYIVKAGNVTRRVAVR